MIPLFLLALPLLEIATFVIVGSKIGVLATIGLVLLSGVAGMVLLRTRGIGALARAQQELQANRDPGPHVVSAAMAVVSAILLMIPGFVTDVISLLLVVPAVRSFVWKRIRSRVAVSGGFTTFQGGFRQTSRPADAQPDGGRVIDLDAADYTRSGNPQSPWRLNNDE